MTRRAARDPLALVELAAVTDEAMSALRHDLRNKLSSMRSAGYYVRRRLAKTEAWASDARLDEMAALLDADAVAANGLLDGAAAGFFARSPASIDAARCVAEAVEHARVDGSVRIEVDAAPARVVADPSELALAIRCIVENAAEATGAGAVAVHGKVEDGRYRIVVRDRGPGLDGEAALVPFRTTKPGRAGIGLNVARRIAQRYRGRIVFEQVEPGAAVALEIPLEEEHGGGDDAADPAGG